SQSLVYDPSSPSSSPRAWGGGPVMVAIASLLLGVAVFCVGTAVATVKHGDVPETLARFGNVLDNVGRSLSTLPKDLVDGARQAPSSLVIWSMLVAGGATALGWFVGWFVTPIFLPNEAQPGSAWTKEMTAAVCAALGFGLGLLMGGSCRRL